MTEDIFRIVVAAAVALACIAFVAQAVVAFALYRVARRMQRTVEPLADRAEPVIGKLGPMIDKIGIAVDKIGPVADRVGPVVDQAGLVLANTNQIMEETRSLISELSDEALGIARSGRQQMERIGELVHDASDRAHARLEQIDEAVESTVEQVGQMGDAMKRAAMRPVREVNGLAAGISAAVSTLVRGSRKPSVDQATQDEEMFI
jgi:methyl-accepting chemotaxis protein